MINTTARPYKLDEFLIEVDTDMQHKTIDEDKEVKVSEYKRKNISVPIFDIMI